VRKTPTVRHSRGACPREGGGGNLFIIMKQPAVYISASKRKGTLYIGVTSDLIKRTWEHKNGIVEGFKKKYNVHQLVYYELHDRMDVAIIRERQLKKWNRAWKIRLIEGSNPKWNDLYENIL
jgi:putative endonuclease